MKRLLLATVGLALMLPDIAIPAAGAQDRPAPGAQRPERPARPPVARPQPRPQPPRPGAGGPQVQPPRPGTGGPQIQPTRPRPPRPGTGGPQIQPPRPQPSRPQPPRPPRPNPGGGHGSNRPRPPRPIPPYRPGQGRPPNFRPIHRPGWHYPAGWAYRRWVAGVVLPALFLHETYYYNDYASLGVGPPPYGYVWVRYGPDLLLVQRATGRIADVIYGAFY